MNVKLIIAVAFFFLVSCNEIKREDNIPTSKIELLTSLEESENDSEKKESEVPEKKEESVSSARIKNIPLVTARGIEPGWYAEFFKDHADLVLEYGKDTVKVNHDFSKIKSDKTYFAKIVEVNNKTKSSINLVIKIETKPCTEASGEKKEHQIYLKYNNKTYKGCATEN